MNARKHALAVLLYGCTHWTKVALLRGWNSWRAIHGKRQRTRMLLGKALAHLSNRLMARGWNSLRATTMATAEKYASLHCCTGHWKEGQLTRAVNCWLTLQSREHRLRDLLKRSIGHGKERQATRGFNAWVESSAERSARIGAENKALSFCDTSGRRVAWTTWQMWWRSLGHGATLLRWSAEHLTHREQSRAFRTWTRMALDMGVYLDVAGMQFSHVVLTPKSEDGPRDIQYIWRGAGREKQDWALLHACQSGHLSTVQTLVP